MWEGFREGSEKLMLTVMAGRVDKRKKEPILPGLTSQSICPEFSTDSYHTLNIQIAQSSCYLHTLGTEVGIMYVYVYICICVYIHIYIYVMYLDV